LRHLKGSTLKRTFPNSSEGTRVQASEARVLEVNKDDIYVFREFSCPLFSLAFGAHHLRPPHYLISLIAYCWDIHEGSVRARTPLERAIRLLKHLNLTAYYYPLCTGGYYRITCLCVSKLRVDEFCNCIYAASIGLVSPDEVPGLLLHNNILEGKRLVEFVNRGKEYDQRDHCYEPLFD